MKWHLRYGLYLHLRLNRYFSIVVCAFRRLF